MVVFAFAVILTMTLIEKRSAGVRPMTASEPVIVGSNSGRVPRQSRRIFAGRRVLRAGDAA